jgi:acyl-CoA-binding protein
MTSRAEKLTEQFKYTTDFIKNEEKLKKLPLTPPTSLSLYLYARAKQFEIGDCNVEQPSIWNISARLKWNSWNSVLGLEKWVAFQEYCTVLREYVLTLTNLDAEARGMADEMIQMVTLSEEDLVFIRNGGFEDEKGLDGGLGGVVNDDVGGIVVIPEGTEEKVKGVEIGTESDEKSEEKSEEKSDEIDEKSDDEKIEQISHIFSSPTTLSQSTPTLPLSQYSSQTTPIVTVQTSHNHNQLNNLSPSTQTSTTTTTTTTTTTPTTSPTLHSPELSQQQHQHPQSPSLITPTTPTKTKSDSSRAESIGSSHTTPQHNNHTPGIRIGSRSARKSFSTKPFHHQTPAQTQSTVVVPNYQRQINGGVGGQIMGGEVGYGNGIQGYNNNNNNNNNTISLPSHTTQSVSNTPTTKEIFLQLQQHATQTQNKQLLLLLALIDQRETSSYLKFQTYKQQQQQHLDFIDSLQQQLNTQFHAQEHLVNSFNALYGEFTALRHAQDDADGKLSPIVIAVKDAEDKIEKLREFGDERKGFFDKIEQKMEFCLGILDQKYPHGWRGILKKTIYWIKWILRFYTIYATVIAVRDIYNWLRTSRWVYKNITFPLQQYLNGKTA